MTDMPEDVAERYAAMPEAARAVLLPVRDMILALAEARPEIGPLSEALRWGEPADLPEASGSGTTLRLAPARLAGHAGMFVSCRTGIVTEWRALFPDFAFEGTRALLLPLGTAPPLDALRHCAGVALTWRLRRLKPRRAASG